MRQGFKRRGLKRRGFKRQRFEVRWMAWRPISARPNHSHFANAYRTALSVLPPSHVKRVCSESGSGAGAGAVEGTSAASVSPGEGVREPLGSE
jgi:hypothetical protein